METFTFYDYIQKRMKGIQRDSIVTDLFADIKRDEEIKEGMTGQEIANHIRWKACEGAFEAMKRIINQYKQYCKARGYESENVVLTT